MQKRVHKAKGKKNNVLKEQRNAVEDETNLEKDMQKKINR